MTDNPNQTNQTGIQTDPAMKVAGAATGSPLNKGRAIMILATLVAGAAVVAGAYVIKHPGQKSLPSADEAQIQSKEAEKKGEAAEKVKNLAQAPIGRDSNFDSQGNFLGPNVAPVELPDNRKASTMGKLAKLDSPEAAIDQLALPTKGDPGYAAFSNGYRPSGGGGIGQSEAADPNVIRERRVDQKEDRELLAAPMLGYSRNRALAAASGPSAQAGTNPPKGMTDASTRQLQALVQTVSQAAPGLAQAGLPAKVGEAPGAGKESTYISAMPGSGRSWTLPGEVADMRIHGGDFVKVPEGKSLECVLVNNVLAQAHQSPMIVTVSRDFRSYDGRLLVPSGTRLVGMADRIEDMNQERLFTSFNRVDFPDQETAWFPQHRLPEGLSPDGALGSQGIVKRGIMKALMASIALGVVEGLGAYASGPVTMNTSTGITTLTPGQEATAHVADNLNRFSDRVLSRYMNMVPQINLRPGTRLRVYLSEDTLMSVYQEGRP